MRDFIRYIKKIVTKKPVEEKTEVDIEFSSGLMKLSWDSETGDFVVDFKIEEVSDASAETVSLLLYYLEKGELNEYILKSLKYRADKIDPEFYAKVILNWASLDNQEMERESDMGQQSIIDPSHVFGLSRR
jgi:hypothetical protein